MTWKDVWRTASVPATILLFVAVGLAPGVAAEDRDVDFDPVPGNDWWVEVYVDAPWQIADVHARANGGAWHGLEEKDWGSWAKSFNAPEGSIVEFRVHGDDGQMETSHKYRWTEAMFLECPPAFEADFKGVRGNEWWVETNVQANDRVTQVDARVDDGEWRELRRTDWGSWARSFHVEEESEVQFRALGDGTVLGGTYVWPEAEQIEEPPVLEAAFGPKASNEWWVETYALSPEPVEKVEACKGDGTWHELTRQEYQAWTKSFHVPDGAELLFRATTESGRTNTSDAYEWPTARPADGEEGWPRDGAYAHYEAQWSGPEVRDFDGHVLYAQRDNLWHILCLGQDADGDDVFEYGNDAPPFGVLPVESGDEVRIQGFHGCGLERESVEVHEQRERDTRQNGDPETVDTWYATSDDEPRNVHWDTDVGIIIAYNDRTVDPAYGELQDTNAPIG